MNLSRLANRFTQVYQRNPRVWNGLGIAAGLLTTVGGSAGLLIGHKLWGPKNQLPSLTMTPQKNADGTTNIGIGGSPADINQPYERRITFSTPEGQLSVGNVILKNVIQQDINPHGNGAMFRGKNCTVSLQREKASDPLNRSFGNRDEYGLYSDCPVQAGDSGYSVDLGK